MRRIVVIMLVSIVVALGARYALSRVGEAGAVAATLPALDRKDGPLDVAFIAPASTLNFYLTLGRGIEAEAGRDRSKVTVLAPRDGADTYTQAGMIQDSISRGVDAIIIATHDDQAVAPMLERAVKAGVAVVVVNSDATEFATPVHAIIGYSQRAALSALGRHLAADPRSTIGILEGLPGYHNSERLAGLTAGLGGNSKIAAQLTGRWSIDGGNRSALDLLQSHPQIDTIVALNDDMAIGAMLAAQSLGRKLRVTGVDGQTVAFEAIAAGGVTATVDTDPYRMGRRAMEVVRETLGGAPAPERIEMPTTIVDNRNVITVLRQPERLFPAPSKAY